MGKISDISVQHWVDENTLLGEKQAEYHRRNLVLLYGVVLSGGLCCSIYIAFISGIVLALCLMAFPILTSAWIWLFRLRVIVYENGFQIRAFLSSQICLWTGIAQVFDYCDKEGQPTYLAITHRNRYAINVPNTLRDFSNLANTIIHQFTEVNFPDSLTVLQRGGVLYFGHITLDATHFEVNSKRLPLSRIETIHLERFGRIQLRVRVTEDDLQWLALSDFPIPNRHLLKKLVVALKAENEPDQPSLDTPTPQSHSDYEVVDVDEPATD